MSYYVNQHPKAHTWPLFHVYYLLPVNKSSHHIPFGSTASNPRHGSPHPIFQTITATAVASVAANITAEGMSVPIIAILVNVAKIPLAGVNPPYIKDWKAAAREPI